MQQRVQSVGDARQLILRTIEDLRSGEVSPTLGMAIAANMKVLNDSLQVEINAAKVAMLARERGFDFGQVARMGTLLIGDATGDSGKETPK